MNQIIIAYARLVPKDTGTGKKTHRKTDALTLHPTHKEPPELFKLNKKDPPVRITLRHMRWELEFTADYREVFGARPQEFMAAIIPLGTVLLGQGQRGRQGCFSQFKRYLKVSQRRSYTARPRAGRTILAGLGRGNKERP
jgi:hypothetical protein